GRSVCIHVYPGVECWVVRCRGVIPSCGGCVVTRGRCAKLGVRGAQPYLGARTVVVMLVRRHDDRWGVPAVGVRPLRSLKVATPEGVRQAHGGKPAVVASG